MRISIAFLFSLLILAGLPPSAPAFDFDDLEKLEKAEQEDLLAKAGQAARSWNFSSARALLKQAQQKGYAPTEIQAAEKLIAQNESAKADQDRRAEEARQAQIAAQEAERQGAMASASSSGGGGSSAGFVSIKAEMVAGFTSDYPLTKICVRRGSGSGGGQGYISNECDWPYVMISPGYQNALAGSYRWEAHFGVKKSISCAGTINVGTKEQVTIKVYRDCRDAGTFQH